MILQKPSETDYVLVYEPTGGLGNKASVVACHPQRPRSETAYVLM